MKNRGGTTRERLALDTRGRGIVEYIVLVGCVTLIALGGWKLFGQSVLHMAQREGHDVETLSSDCPYCDQGGGPSRGGPVGSTVPAGGGATQTPAIFSPPSGGNARGASNPTPPPPPTPPPTPVPNGTGGSAASSPPSASASLSGNSNGHGPLPTWAQGAIGFGQGVLQGLAPGGWITNFIPGLVPPELANSPAYRYWNGAGQISGGLATAAAGAGEEVVGGVLDATGIGAAVGVPVNVVATVQIASGVTSIAAGAAQMAAAGQQLQSQPAGGNGGNGEPPGGGGSGSAGGGSGGGGGGRIRPVNGTVNVGGGLESGSESATNLNPIKPGSGGPARGIPNHVKAGFEDIGKVFEPGSVNKIISNRLRYGDVNWPEAAKGASQVMAKGGKLSMNVWTSSPQEAQAVVDAFSSAGFKGVRAIGEGPGTIIVGEF